MDVAGTPRRVAEGAAADPPPLELHGCTVDLAAGRVLTTEGEVRGLTRLEVRLLGYLAAHAGDDVAREELLREVWQATASSRAVDFTVRRLREKLGEPAPPRHVLTAHGVGYRFVGATAPPRPAAAPAPRKHAGTVPLATGDVDLDRLRFQPHDGPAVPLTATEGALVAALADRPGQLVPRDDLVVAVWGAGHRGRSLEATLSRLRDKVDPERTGVLTSHRHAGVRLERADRGRAADPGWVDRPEQRAVADAVAPGRWVTLVGPPGTGKTALARRVVEAAGGRWVALDRVDTEVELVAAVAEALGGPPEDRLAAAVPGTVIGLDTLEQLLDEPAARARLAAWAALARGIVLLATSRAAIGLPDERVVPIGGLSPTAGARLFRLRAGFDADGDDRSRVDALAVATAVRLEGNPFAIELAAARARREPPAALLARPDEELLDLLVRRPPGATSQHSTLRAALDPSWDRLDAEARAVLIGCAPIRGPLDPALARAATHRPSAAEALDVLADQSLLVRTGERYRWVGPVRSYAAERLARSPAAAEARAGCAAAVLDAVEDALQARHVALADAADRLAARAEDLDPLCRAEAPRVRSRASLAAATWALHVGQHDQAAAAARAALDLGVPGPFEAPLYAVLAATSPAADRAAWITRGRTAASDADDPVHVELARAELAAHRDQLRLGEAIAAGRALAASPRVRRVSASLRGRVWLDLAGAIVLSAQRGWEDPLQRAEDEARTSGDALLLAHVLRLRALGLSADRDASAACRDELLTVARGLHGAALPHGSLVRLVTVEQPWGALQRTPFGQRPCPFDVDLVFDVSGRLVASWLDLEWGGASRPEDALRFSRSIALLAAGAPAMAVQAAAPAGRLIAARAVLAMARAESGDAEAAADGLRSVRARDSVDARLLELASAHVALVGRERDGVDRARAALAAAPPGERPMAVSLVRARLEAVIAVGPGASAFHDARTSGSALR